MELTIKTIKGQELIEDRSQVKSGNSLMQYIVYRLQCKLTLVESSCGESLRAPNNKKFYLVFR